MKEILEIAFDLTPDDLSRLQRRNRPEFGWRSVVVVLIVFVTSLSFTILPSVLRRGDWKALGFSVAVPLAAIAVLWVLFLWMVKRGSKAVAVLNPHRVVRIAPDGFKEDDSISVTATQWQGFTKIDADEVLLYFLMDVKRAHIIPKRAFSSAQDAAAFYQTACDYWQSAKNGTPAPAPTRSPDWPPPPGR